VIIFRMLQEYSLKPSHKTHPTTGQMTQANFCGI
jgi:hypothetical protein